MRADWLQEAFSRCQTDAFERERTLRARSIAELHPAVDLSALTASPSTASLDTVIRCSGCGLETTLQAIYLEGGGDSRLFVEEFVAWLEPHRQCIKPLDPPRSRQ